MASTPIHKDLVGREIAVDDIIVTTFYQSLVVGKVLKLNPKKIQYKTIYCADYKIAGRLSRQYPHRMAIIENTPHIITLMLKGAPQ